MWQAPPKKPLRQRIREAGGFYHWFNATLIRLAGPPHVGVRAKPLCMNCGRQKNDHLLIGGEVHCPDGARA
ncbi:hypothetical protein GCM10010915_24760 [Microbacterium faecale]|uniref:Uncharacterized protein n=1 Tax=Microbacterium faecale TaxID=1804630 RepID=A0A917DK61_9MICO|nr:hypothetical protein [Microbacterium faecale]GGD42713.1 hypothetical protein GCM10010915_24760 [Microbacterium faecale]HJB63804.1 hypothetical protein [Candidatus Microbacterium pullistercoris]